MEIIDFHTHLVPANQLNPHMTEFFKETNPEFIVRVSDFDDPKVTVELFKNQGIKYAVVLAEEAPATTYNVPTEQVLEYCRGQDMLIPFASINPNSYPEPAKRLTEYVTEHGARGLKLLPSYQFYYLNEASLYSLFARAQELKVPVLIHIGSSMLKGTRMRYCDPMQLADIAGMTSAFSSPVFIKISIWSYLDSRLRTCLITSLNLTKTVKRLYSAQTGLPYLAI